MSGWRGAAAVMLTAALGGPTLHAPAEGQSPSCTARYAQRPHVSQAAAKTFGRTCLAQAGAVAQRLTRSAVSTKLAGIVDASHPLARTVPQDVAAFCPAYPRLAAADRAVMWQTMLSTIAERESALQPAEPYWEVDQHQYSIGLLQLSLADERGYACGIRKEADLADPDLNLRCGAKILARLVARDGRIGGDAAHRARGGAAYWSTLREPSLSRRPEGAPPRDSRAAVIRATRGLPSCQARAG